MENAIQIDSSHLGGIRESAEERDEEVVGGDRGGGDDAVDDRRNGGGWRRGEAAPQRGDVGRERG